MNNDEIFFTMALTRISNFNYATALELYPARLLPPSDGGPERLG